MPRGDGTGSVGMGLLTGRGAGYCAGFAGPGFANAAGRGFGGGFGASRGLWFGGFAPAAPTVVPVAPTNETAALKAQAQNMQNALEQINARIAQLEEGDNVPTMVCVNKWDINPHVTESIEHAGKKRGIHSVGNVPLDKSMVDAQIHGKPVVEYDDSPAARQIRLIWHTVAQHLGLRGWH